MSRKYVERDVSKDEEDSEGDDDEEGEISGSYFDPDMFMYGAMQGSMKMSMSASPSLMAAVGDKLCEIWEGIRTFFTGDFETTDITELAGIVVPGTERGTFITYDLTYYLNDTNFNEYSQVMYQYGEDGREKASYVYGAYDERISADLTNAAVAYVNDRSGSYTYLYDGQGNVTQNLLNGREANSYYYDPFGNVEDGVEDNDIIFGYNGEEYTGAAQLQYLRQRHYAPDMGAFLTQDAYRGDFYEPITQNRYAYAVNDPVNYNDPGGDRASSKSISNALNNLASAVKTASIKNSLAVIEEAVNKVGWTTQYRVNNPSASEKDAEAAYYVDKGLKATVQANATLMQAVKNLQTGVECKGSKGNSSSSHKRSLSEKAREQQSQNIKGLHDILSAAGMIIPAADLLNAGLYLMEGDYKNAAFSAGTAIPVAGDFLFVGKVAYKGNKIVNKSGKGAFYIDDWTGYPNAPRPTGPFHILEGEEYDVARRLANMTNANIHKQSSDLKGLHIHEMHPIKFGGSPTDIDNKIALTPKEHAQYTVFWNKVLKEKKDQ